MCLVFINSIGWFIHHGGQAYVCHCKSSAYKAWTPRKEGSVTVRTNLIEDRSTLRAHLSCLPLMAAPWDGQVTTARAPSLKRNNLYDISELYEHFKRVHREYVLI